MSDAILLVNMGGPERLEMISAYLRAIFRDPAIIPLPRWLRPFITELILKARLKTVTERYRQIGGSSPLLHWTEQLQCGLETVLREQGNETPVFHAFRYTSPTLEETINSLAVRQVSRFTLVPLFPHYTAAMTGSIVREARRVAGDCGIRMRVTGAWGLAPDVIDLWRNYLRTALEQTGANSRVLFVAHGIPLRNVQRGEDYPVQVHRTAEEVSRILPETATWSLAFQSRLGPIRWTGPYLEQELSRLCETKEPIIIVPLSFAADCLETLYDLDTVAVPFARKQGIERVVRVPAFNDDPRFAIAMARWIEQEEHHSDV